MKALLTLIFSLTLAGCSNSNLFVYNSSDIITVTVANDCGVVEKDKTCEKISSVLVTSKDRS